MDDGVCQDTHSPALLISPQTLVLCRMRICPALVDEIYSLAARCGYVSLFWTM